MHQAILVEAGRSQESDSWDQALANGMATMCDFITEDSVLLNLEAQFGQLILGRCQAGAHVAFMSMSADLLMERRLSGRGMAGRGSQALIVASARAAMQAHSTVSCPIDTLAMSARCLGEAGLLTGDIQASSFIWKFPLRGGRGNQNVAK